MNRLAVQEAPAGDVCLQQLRCPRRPVCRRLEVGGGSDAAAPVAPPPCREKRPRPRVGLDQQLKHAPRQPPIELGAHAVHGELRVGVGLYDGRAQTLVNQDIDPEQEPLPALRATGPPHGGRHCTHHLSADLAYAPLRDLEGLGMERMCDRWWPPGRRLRSW